MKGVLMEVPFERIDEVRTLLEGPGPEGGAYVAVDPPDRAEILRRIFADCAEGTQKILLHLAKHPGDWIYGYELSKVANPESESINTSPYFRSLGVAQKRHLPPGAQPIEQAKRGRDRLFQFMMTPEDAKIVQGFAE